MRTVSWRHLSVRIAILTIIEGQFQVFQRFPSSKLELEAVESCFGALSYYEIAVLQIYHQKPMLR